MANIVGEIIFDISERIRDPKQGDANPGYILRTMNRIYKRFNTRYYLLNGETDLTLDEFGKAELPADYHLMFYCSKEVTIVDKRDWTSEAGTATIMGGYIYFASFEDEELVTIRYHRSGYDLLDTPDALLEELETNTPEWPEQFWELLMLATAIDLSNTYPKYADDVALVNELKGRLMSWADKPEALAPAFVSGNNQVDITSITDLNPFED